MPNLDFARIQTGFQSRYPETIQTLDSHTAGEPTRLVIGGIPDIPGTDMAAKRVYFQEHLDHIRCLLNREPRGNCDLLTAVLTEPVSKDCDFGLIYMDAKRYPYLCGHATIGAVANLIETGAIRAEPGEFTVRVDTPSGVMPARVRVGTGNSVTSVSISMVPSFVYQTDRELRIPGHAPLRVDTVCVGGYFVMLDVAQLGLHFEDIRPDSLADLGMTIIEEANRQLEVAHPERPEVNSIDVVEIYQHQEQDPTRGRSLVVYGEAHVDRSPCGTGTAAKVTLLHHQGQLSSADVYSNQGPAGTSFQARIREETRIGNIPGVVVEITGSAHITGFHRFALDPADPFPTGFLL